jgi:hypothetical protein
MSTETPDGVPCRHCGLPISWDEICWTHNDTGFADCGLVISGGNAIVGDQGRMIAVIDPQLNVEGPHKGQRAEPVGEWS